MLSELPLWGLEKPLREGDAVLNECSPSDARFFSGRWGGSSGGEGFCPSSRSLSVPPFPSGEGEESGQRGP